MPIPIRCFSCGKVLGAFEMRVERYLDEGKEFAEIFELLGLEKWRYCCRGAIMTNVDLNKICLRYTPLPREG